MVVIPILNRLELAANVIINLIRFARINVLYIIKIGLIYNDLFIRIAFPNKNLH
jgi:hypothetical protein